MPCIKSRLSGTLKVLTAEINEAPFGLTILNVDCANWDDTVAREVESLVREHEVLVFPNQGHLTPSQEVAFYRAVNLDCDSIWRDQINNPWEKHKIAQGNKAGTYQIPDEPGVLVLGKGKIKHYGLNVTLGGERSAYGKDAGSQVLGGGSLQWHIDGPFYNHHPCQMTQMRCIEAPAADGHWIDYNDGSGDRIWCAAGATAFASGRIAFESLSEEQATTCLNTRVHYASKPFQNVMHLENNSNGLRVIDPEEKHHAQITSSPASADDPLAKVYPLVWRCQQTGEHALMPHPRCLRNLEVLENDTGNFLSVSESRSKIASLMRPAVSPSNIYVHPWKPGDLVLWNNHSVWHSATGKLSTNDRRIMHLTAFNASSPPTCNI